MRGPSPAKPSKPSTIKPINSPRICALSPMPKMRWPSAEDGRSGHGGLRTNDRHPSRSGRIRSGLDPQHRQRLNLHSDSSYRFERRMDPEGLDWASRRCCELILELGGGELAAGAVDVGQRPPQREPVVLRFSQLKRILGIEVPPQRVSEILLALGNVVAADNGAWTSRRKKPQKSPRPVKTSP